MVIRRRRATSDDNISVPLAVYLLRGTDGRGAGTVDTHKAWQRYRHIPAMPYQNTRALHPSGGRKNVHPTALSVCGMRAENLRHSTGCHGSCSHQLLGAIQIISLIRFPSSVTRLSLAPLPLALPRPPSPLPCDLPATAPPPPSPITAVQLRSLTHHQGRGSPPPTRAPRGHRNTADRGTERGNYLIRHVTRQTFQSILVQRFIERNITSPCI